VWQDVVERVEQEARARVARGRPRRVGAEQCGHGGAAALGAAGERLRAAEGVLHTREGGVAAAEAEAQLPTMDRQEAALVLRRLGAQRVHEPMQRGEPDLVLGMRRGPRPDVGDVPTRGAAAVVAQAVEDADVAERERAGCGRERIQRLRHGVTLAPVPAHGWPVGQHP
jgi:hypothetical protein